MGEVQHQKSGCVVFVAVCYVPPVGLSRDVGVDDCLLLLKEDMVKSRGRIWCSV